MDVACDCYHRYKEDIAMMKYMGVTAYRFSIAWTRILPNGSLKAGINQQGIDHYNNVLKELELNGIEPYVTLFHFDLPQALEDKYGGILSIDFVKDFRDYCDVCFKEFGEKVKHWVTINEAPIVAENSYCVGLSPPRRCSPWKGCKVGDSGKEPYIVLHHMILAHAVVAKLYKEKYKDTQGGEVGISLVGIWCPPYSDSPEDLAAAERIRDFRMGWCLEPFFYGHYPISMKNLVKDRLPTFSDHEKRMVMGSLDFISINYYSSNYAKGLPLIITEPYSWDTDSCVQRTQENARGEFIGPLQDLNSPFRTYPEGLRQLLVHLTHRYDSPKLYISENGTGRTDENTKEFLQGKLNDEYRIQFILDHLDAVKRAREEGADVVGFFVWSLLDDFEFDLGCSYRFGLMFTDFDDNQRRIPKRSMEWYHSFLTVDE
ncbi:hypothetical protein AQUCO_01100256v1 [Aquilegia coerulea]|uniref:Thioglucosidase n=1 Tax=Aquilegia coerulea TaxID=218851 RepID=A0A2G5E6H0_AQUCA|nr:hypothetical protein AQUCO_01100256v1 [Aquilegia coerulea]